MKIVLFTENYYKGGLDTFIISLINNWPNKNDHIELICNYDHPGNETYNSQIKRNFLLTTYSLYNRLFLVKKLDKISPIKYINNIIGYIFKYPLFIKNIFVLQKILLKNMPDRLMVINGGYPGGDFCRAATISWGLFSLNKHSIHNFHNIAHTPRKLLFIFEYIIDKMINKYSRYLVSVSKYASESILSRRGFSGTNKIKYIYNGINQKNIGKNQSLHSDLDIENNNLICVMLGTYEVRKGHDFVFKAFRKTIDIVSNVHLLCAGYGSKEEIQNVNELVVKYNLTENVHIRGFINEVENIISQADLLLIGSQAFESFGYTAIEAMSYQVPVIATNVGGLPEVVMNGEGGYCLDNSDAEGYANKIIELLNDESIRTIQGRKGYFRYKQYFTAEKMATEYSMLIKEKGSV